MIDKFIPWQPNEFIVPRYQLVDELCLATYMMEGTAVRKGVFSINNVASYDLVDLDVNARQVTWAILMMLHHQES